MPQVRIGPDYDGQDSGRRNQTSSRMAAMRRMRSALVGAEETAALTDRPGVPFGTADRTRTHVGSASQRKPARLILGRPVRIRALSRQELDRFASRRVTLNGRRYTAVDWFVDDTGLILGAIVLSWWW
jgi:hypothetical protein